MATQDRWGVRSLYLYLVCLVTLVMAIFAAVQMVRSGVELLYPAPATTTRSRAWTRPRSGAAVKRPGTPTAGRRFWGW